MQPTSRGRLRPLRGGGWEERRKFSQPDASLPALPSLAAAAADTLSRPPVPAGASKHPSLVPIEKIGRGLASEGAALAHSFPALPNPPPSPQAPVSRTNRKSKTWPRKRGCSPGSLPARAALPRPPLTTARDAQCTGPRYAYCSAMLSTQPCPHPRSFSTKIGRTRYRPDAAQHGLIQRSSAGFRWDRASWKRRRYSVRCRSARRGPGSASAWGFGSMSDPANSVAGGAVPAWGGWGGASGEVAVVRPPRGAGPWRRWRGCVRHEGGSVAAEAVAVAAGGSRSCRSRHWRKHRPAAGKHGKKGGAWQQQWATGTESAEPRGYHAASPATPPRSRLVKAALLGLSMTPRE